MKQKVLIPLNYPNLLKFTMLMYFGPSRSTTKGFFNKIFYVPGSTNYMFLPFSARKLKYCMHIYLETYGSTKKGFCLKLNTPGPRSHTLFITHQLYVGCSRVSHAQTLHVVTENNRSYNVVHRAV